MNPRFELPPKTPGEENGITNHIHRMSQGPDKITNTKGQVVAHEAYFNRVIIVTDDPLEAGLIQSRLPKVFHELEPIKLDGLFKSGIRPEPQQLLYASTEFLKSLSPEQGAGCVFFYAYSLIGKNNNGQWADMRDATSTKWGRACEGWHSNPDTIQSEKVLNGEAIL